MLRAVAAFVIAGVLTPFIRLGLKKWNVVDVPNERSFHHAVTPRGGGLSVLLAVVVTLAVAPSFQGPTRSALLMAGLGFAAVGLLEDLVGIPALRRLPLLFAAAAATLPWLLDGLRGPLVWQVVFGVGAAVWLVAFVNAFNFMDGINGLAAGQVIVAGAAWYALAQSQDLPWLETTGLILTGAALGFLPWNAPKAFVFLGDVGSYFLGATLACTAVLALRAGLTVEAVFAPLAVYLADTAATLVRRVRAGECWWEAHRAHVYQRLCERYGGSHGWTALAVVAVMAACAALGLLSMSGSLAVRVAADVGMVALLAAYVASPALLGRVRPREPALA